MPDKRMVADKAGKLAALSIEIASLEKQKESILGRANPSPQDMWCADFTTTLTPGATVGAAIIPGEGLENMILRPGYEGRNQWNPQRDGIILPREWQTEAQVFFNAAILPGWQKFRPTFRTGRITAIDKEANTCTVSIDSAQSSAQSLNVNQFSSLSGVSIEYMQCNALAFEEGDDVLIAFEGDWGSPKVIGFASHPKPCVIWPEYRFHVASLSITTNPMDSGFRSSRTVVGLAPQPGDPGLDYTPPTSHRRVWPIPAPWQSFLLFSSPRRANMWENPWFNRESTANSLPAGAWDFSSFGDFFLTPASGTAQPHPLDTNNEFKAANSGNGTFYTFYSYAQSSEDLPRIRKYRVDVSRFESEDPINNTARRMGATWTTVTDQLYEGRYQIDEWFRQMATTSMPIVPVTAHESIGGETIEYEFYRMRLLFDPALNRSVFYACYRHPDWFGIGDEDWPIQP